MGFDIDRIKKMVKKFPPVESILRNQYDEEFSNAPKGNLFRGVFPTFQDAILSAPKSKNIGYDNPEPATIFSKMYERINPGDYPVLYWLERVADGNAQVFDYGGYVGGKYYVFRKYLTKDLGHSWFVYDVPEVVRMGRELASKRKVGLKFTTDFQVLEGKEILLCLGSLQYIETPLSERVSALKNMPRHILINGMPLTGREGYVTLQSIGAAFCPYLIQNEQEFIVAMEKIGYTLVDKWRDPTKSCEIPFHEEYSLAYYTGIYFKRTVTP